MPAMKRPASYDAEVSKVKKALTEGDVGTSMLAGMCKATLTVPKEERHEFQSSVVGMIEEALGAMETGYKSSCDSMKATVDGCPADKVTRAAAVVDAEKELVGLKEAVKASKEALGVAAKGLEEAAAALTASKKEQKTGDAVLTALEAKKGKITAVQTECLTPMGEEGAKADSKALKTVLKMGKELSLDHSLLMVMPELVKKPKEARSAFEDTSYQSIVGEFTKHIDALAAQIAEGEPGKAARAEAVAAATAAKEAAEKTNADAEAALEAAKTAEKAGVAALKAAEKRVASWLADSKKAMDAYDEAVVKSKEFVSVLSTFAELKELTPPPPPVEEPEEPPAEEAPAEEAPEPEPETASFLDKVKSYLSPRPEVPEGAVDTAIDKLETKVGSDLDGDGEVAGVPVEAAAEEVEAATEAAAEEVPVEAAAEAVEAAVEAAPAVPEKKESYLGKVASILSPRKKAASDASAADAPAADDAAEAAEAEPVAEAEAEAAPEVAPEAEEEKPSLIQKLSKAFSSIIPATPQCLPGRPSESTLNASETSADAPSAAEEEEAAPAYKAEAPAEEVKA